MCKNACAIHRPWQFYIMAIAAYNNSNLVWLDLEMTGLDTQHDSVLEIATVVTDAELNVLAEGPELAILHSKKILEQMDAWNWNQHKKSGLWQRVLDSQTSMQEAELLTLDFLRNWLPENSSPICGNSICHDRRFMHRLMPTLERYFHYRNLDVSTIKELAQRWCPEILKTINKESAHTALKDVYDSINELRSYRCVMGDFAPRSTPSRYAR